MVGYSVDLRQRVVAAVDAGMTQERAAVVFCVSVNSIQRWMARRRATGCLAPTAQRHGPAPVKKEALCAWLPARLDTAADATLRRAIGALPPGDDPGVRLTLSGRRRAPGRPLKQRP